jgi:hypothetical protein
MFDILPDNFTAPHFPMIWFLVAFFADTVLAFIIAGVTFVLPPIGWPLGVLTSFIIGGSLLLWRFFHSNGKIKKMGKFSFRLGVVFLINLIPILRLILPEYMALVMATYLEDKKAYQKRRNVREATAAPA